jgi:hypothetical protein
MKTDWIIKVLFIFLGVLIIGVILKPKYDNFCVSCKSDAECANGMKCVNNCCVPE